MRSGASRKEVPLRFIAEQVDSGRSKDASEVLRAGLRLLEQETQASEQKLKMLRELAAEGFREIDHGDSLKISNHRELRGAIAAMGKQVAKTHKHRNAE